MGTDDHISEGLTPDDALVQGRWVKLICGASNQDLPAIADLTAVFAAVGVHSVDVAADPAVALAARRGLDWAEAQTRGLALWQWPEGWKRALSLARPLVAPWLQRSC